MQELCEWSESKKKNINPLIWSEHTDVAFEQDADIVSFLFESALFDEVLGNRWFYKVSSNTH